jgi:RNA polymerase sigma-70 factor (ECF subfamily)
MLDASSAPTAYYAVTVDWAGVYERHAGELTSYLARYVGDRELASELMQETFARGIRAEQSIREPGAIRGWLFQTATNLALNERRRRALFRFLPFSGLERSPHEAFDPAAEQVNAALRSIGSDQAVALLLRYHSGFSVPEVARMLGVGEETVKSRIGRGRQNFMAAYRRIERGLAR